MSRIRANQITNQSADGAPTVQNGLVISGVTTSTTFSGSGASLTNLNASNIASGTVPTARLGSGTANSSTFLAGDSTFKTITGTTINNNATTKFITGTNNANELDCEANLSYNNSLVTFASSSLLVSKSTSPTISVKETAGNKEGAFRANTDGVLLRTLGNYPLIFHTNQTERAQIDGSGRFLIGTNSVYNANSYSNNLIVYENGDAGASIIGNASNSNYASLYLTDTTTAIKGYLEAQLGVNGNFTIGANGTGPIRFTNNGAERLRISSTGNLALGSTHESGFSNHTNFFLGGMGNLYVDTSASSGSSFSMSNNAYINSAGNWVYRTGGKASNIYHYEGAIGFRNAGTGSAGNTISWSEKLKIDNNGIVTQPSQPSFAAYKAANSFTQSGVIVFDATRHNIGSHYNTSNGRFTAPVDGRYQFTFYSIIKGNYSNAYFSIRINGSAGSGMYVHVSQNIGNIWDGMTTTWILDLNASDYVDINSNSSINWHGNDWQLFSGHLLG